VATSAAGFSTAMSSVGALTVGSLITDLKTMILSVAPGLSEIQTTYGEALVTMTTVLNNVKALIGVTLSIIEYINSLPDPATIPFARLGEIWAALQTAIAQRSTAPLTPMPPSSAPGTETLPMPYMPPTLTPLAPTVAPLGEVGTTLDQILAAVLGINARPVAVNVYLDGQLVKQYIDEGIAEAMAQ